MVGKYWSRILSLSRWCSLCEWMSEREGERASAKNVGLKISGGRTTRSDIKVAGPRSSPAVQDAVGRSVVVGRAASVESKLVYQGRKKERDERASERAQPGLMNQTHGQRTTWEHKLSSSGVLTPIFNWQRFRASERERDQARERPLCLGDNRQAVLVAGNGEMKSPFSHSHTYTHTRMP